jgi:hypothetical protein
VVVVRSNPFHALPTHLGVRDPILWGLTDVQLLRLATGVVVAGCVWHQMVLPVGLRTALGVLALVGAILCALVRVGGRHLDEWLLIAGRYYARPRALVWRSRLCPTIPGRARRPGRGTRSRPARALGTVCAASACAGQPPGAPRE